MTAYSLVWVISFLLATSSVVGCATAPVIRVDQGKPQAHLLGLDQQLQEDSHQLEEKLEREGAIFDDPTLTSYLEEMGKRVLLASASQGALAYKFRVVRDPTVNAYALPNGRSYYHVGLLARARNPDMLAAVMAHELSHSIHRDSLYLRDDLRQKTVAAKIMELPLVTGASIVGAGSLASLTLNVVYATSVTGYGREKEARADRFAMERLQAAGMNPAATAQLFETFLKEEERYRKGPEIWFLMSHPTTRKRLQELKEWLTQQNLKDLKPPEDDPAFLKLTDPARLEAASLDVRYERYYHALDHVKDILSRDPGNPTALNLEAECYRRLAEDSKAAEMELNAKKWKEVRAKKEEDWKTQWQQKAQEAFERLLSANPSSPDAHRGLGMLHASRAETPMAIQHLEAYLSLKPEAKDRRFVASRIEQLRKEKGKP